jgi:filamentous hemagglutinin
VTITANGADTSSSDALQITGGSTLSSDASAGVGGAGAGTITLTAEQGSVQIGLAGDATQTTISSSAGASAGLAGPVIMTGGKGIALGDANVQTTAASTSASGAGATITLTANQGAGPLSLANSTLDASTIGSQSGGDITLTGSQITTSNTKILSTTGGVSSAGSITISGSTVAMTGTQATVSTTGSGGAGRVTITASGADPTSADALQITGGSTITSDASAGVGGAAAGTINLTAAQGSVQIGVAADAGPTTVSSSAGANAGLAGAVSVVSGKGITLGNAEVDTTAGSSSATGGGATITLTADGGAGPLSIANSTLDASTSGSQAGGSISLTGSQVAISNDTQILAQTTGTANAGSIDITGTSISIDPTMISSSTTGTGAAGPIEIVAQGALTITGSEIFSSSSGPGVNAGAAGSITLSGAPVLINGGSQIAATILNGTPQAVGDVGPTPVAGIEIASSGPTAGISILGTPGAPTQITTQANQANGGDITLSPGGGPVLIDDSLIKASAGIGGTTALGQGGSISIGQAEPGAGAGRVILESSAILAQADGGAGGQIDINPTPGAPYIQDANSIVNADSKAGNNGTVSINAPQTDLNSALQPPQVSTARAAELSANACQPGANHSTFVRDEHGGVAPAPDDYLSGHAPATSTTSEVSPGSGKPDAALLDVKQLFALAAAGCR